MALSTAVTGIVLAVPVVSTGSPTSQMALDSSSSSATRFAEESSPVVMGRDGLDPSSPAAVAPPATGVPATEVPTTEVPTTGVPTTEVPTTPAPAEVVVTPEASAPETTSEAPSSAVAPTPPPRTAAGAPAPGLEGEVLALVNTARAIEGCAPLVEDAGLAGVARAHSADMRDRDFFDHTNPDDLDPFDRADAAGQTHARAENIAHGQRDATAVMDAWMNSRGHRANILDCELRTLGVGIAEGPGGPWWTQLFGS